MTGKSAIELAIHKLDVKLESYNKNLHGLQGMVASLNEYRTILVSTIDEIEAEERHKTKNNKKKK